MKTQFEYTDTFAGEANYSWVRRAEVELPDNASRLAVVRKAKQWAGINGTRARVTDYGDLLEIRPAGICAVLFVSFSH